MSARKIHPHLCNQVPQPALKLLQAHGTRHLFGLILLSVHLRMDSANDLSLLLLTLLVVVVHCFPFFEIVRQLVLPTVLPVDPVNGAGDHECHRGIIGANDAVRDLGVQEVVVPCLFLTVAKFHEVNCFTTVERDETRLLKAEPLCEERNASHVTRELLGVVRLLRTNLGVQGSALELRREPVVLALLAQRLGTACCRDKQRRSWCSSNALRQLSLYLPTQFPEVFS
mmetsp:Transcript_31843/g.62648  ORF Transcript_31843/g.62648 Transcript_31843/m.62648 type:complete len:227 (+) Transcript_31843:141-821(+)